MRVQKSVRVLSVALILVVSGLAVHAEVLTFDDVTNVTGTETIIPDGYGGFNWDEFGVVDYNYVIGSGYDNGRVSGDYVAFNRFARVATIDDGLFDFNSAYLTAAWNNGLNINVQGFAGGSLLYDRTVVVDSAGPTLFNFDYLGIDQLVFDSYGGVYAGYGYEGEHFAMDNFTFNEDTDPPLFGFFDVLGDDDGPSSILDLLGGGLGSSPGGPLGGPLVGPMGMGLGVMPIPEPSSIALSLLGLLGLIAQGWRRRK